MNLMKSAICISPMQYKLETIPIPKPMNKEVLVKLEGCGVCASNIPIWEGRPWFRYPFDAGAPGHEGWGSVHEIGSNVKDIKIGQRVAILSQRAFAEFDIVNENALVPIPSELDGLPFPAEPIGCAINIFKRSKISRENTVAILGIGFIGAVLIKLCVNAGAYVIAISRRTSSLELAERYGAQHIIKMEDKNSIISKVNSITKNKGCDKVIEATGYQIPLDIASEITSTYGDLIIAGYHQDGLRTVNMQQWNWKAINVINAHERDNQKYLEGIKKAVELVQFGFVDVNELCTHQYDLSSLNQAFEITRSKPEGFIKAIISYV